MSYISILVFLLIACKPQQLVKNDSEQILIDASEDVANKKVQSLIRPYKSKLDSSMNEVLGVCDIEMPIGKYVSQSLVGNFVADLTLKYGLTKIDKAQHQNTFCLLNKGGIRSNLPEGTITRGHLFELMPFENQVVIVELSGKELITVSEYLQEKDGQPISGASITLNVATPRLIINNTAIDKNAIYKVITSDYLANGGDSMKFFVGKPQQILDKLRDVIINYVIETKEITSKLDKRITYAK